MTKTFLRCVAAALALTLASGAHAACNNANDLAISNASPQISYDPLGPTQATVTSTVTVTNNKNGVGNSCGIRVNWVRTGGAWDLANGDTLTVATLNSVAQGTSPASHSLAASTATSAAIVVPANGASRTFTLTATIPINQYVSPVAYSRGVSMSFDFADDAGGPFTQGSSTTGSLAANVQQAVNFNIAGTSTAFGGGDASQNYSVDFGDMTTGETSNIFIQFRGNANVSTSFVSANGGMLKHANNVSTIPYALVVNGASLASATGSQTMAANTGSSGVATYPIGITLGNVAGGAAGAYSDTITVTITPQ